MPRNSITDPELLELHADPVAKASLAAEEARLIGLRDQLAAAIERRTRAQDAHTAAILAGEDTGPTREATIGASVDVEGLERAVASQEQDVERSRAAILDAARLGATQAADGRLSIIQRDAAELRQEIARASAALERQYQALDRLRSAEIDAAIARASLAPGSLEVDRLAFQPLLRVPAATRAERDLRQLLAAPGAPAVDLSRAPDPEAIAAMVAVITTEETRS